MKAPADRRRSRFSRLTLILLGAGSILIAVYCLLSRFQVGKFGAESDIGGGLVLLAGCSLAGLGAVLAIIDLKRR